MSSTKKTPAPTSNPAHTGHNPWLLGKEAQWDNRDEKENPFPEGSEDWNDWRSGYRDAEQTEDIEAEEGHGQ